MTTTPELADLERRTFRAAVGDGLPELVLGTFFLAIAIAIAGRGLDLELLGVDVIFFLPALTLALAIPLWTRLRGLVTEPRIGTVRLRSGRLERLRRQKTTTALAFWMAALLLVSVKGAAPGAVEWIRAAGNLSSAVFLAILAGTVGFVLEIRRLYLEAAIIVLVGVIAHLAGARLSTAAFVAAALVLVTGAVVLTAFVRRNPIEATRDGA